jgi:hypothetical protein
MENGRKYLRMTTWHSVGTFYNGMSQDDLMVADFKNWSF